MRSVASAASLCTPYVVIARQFCFVYLTSLEDMYRVLIKITLFYSVSEYATGGRGVTVSYRVV
jgi:hypothetical protein